MQVGVSTWYPDNQGGGAAFYTSFLSALSPNFAFSRASSANYFDAAGVRQAAAQDVPRIEYNPVSLQSRGLALEESRTNFLLNSLAPATQTTASLTTGTYVLWMEGGGSVTSSAGTAVGSGFGAATGGALGTYGTPNIFTVTTAGTVTVTVSGSPTSFQLEKGPSPSSLITTTGASATRAREICSMTDIATTMGYVAGPGTLAVEWMAGQGATAGVVARVDFGDGNVEAINQQTASIAQAFSRDNFVNMATIALGSGTPVFGTVYKGAFGWQADNFAGCVNGGTVQTDTLGTIFTPLTKLLLGARAADQYLNGWIRSLSYYSTRLSNSQILALVS